MAPGQFFNDVYLFQMVVDPAGPGFDLNVPVEVVIGNIPLRQIAQQHGLTLPTAPPPPAPGQQQAAPGVPENLYTDLNKPASLPQATFAESAFGKFSTKEDGDAGDGQGQTEYAPVYTYYNWDKPNDNFAVKWDE